jgi:hypothetical protein
MFQTQTNNGNNLFNNKFKLWIKEKLHYISSAVFKKSSRPPERAFNSSNHELFHYQIHCLA